jgi:mono/diheme cytochrome c family protein
MFTQKAGIGVVLLLVGFFSNVQCNLAQTGDDKRLSAETSSATGIASKSAQQNRTSGEELYNASCAVCHGARATGGIGPRLAGNPVLSNDQAFKKVLKEGRHMMPPLTDVVTEEQIAGIRSWLKTLP